MKSLREYRTRAVWIAGGVYALTYALLGLWSSAPLSLLTAKITAHSGRGDGPLFDAGATFLVEAVRLHAAAYSAALQATLLQWGCSAVVLLVPLAGVFAALAQPQTTARCLSTRAARHIPGFVLLGALSLICRAVVAGVVLLFFGAAQALLAGSLSETVTNVLGLIAFLVFAAAQLLVSMCFDFAKSAVAVRAWSAFKALPLALECQLRGFIAHCSLRLLSIGLSLCCPVLAYLLSLQLDTAGSAVWSQLALAVSHQLAILGLVLGRLIWFGYTSAVIGSTPTELSPAPLNDTAE